MPQGAVKGGGKEARVVAWIAGAGVRASMCEGRACKDYELMSAACVPVVFVAVALCTGFLCVCV